MSEGDVAVPDVVIALKEAEHRPRVPERHPTRVEKVAFWHVHDSTSQPRTSL